MFLFTLLYLRRIKPLQYINPPIIVRFPERNGAFTIDVYDSFLLFVEMRR